MQSRIVARLTAPVVAVSVSLIVVALGAAWYVRDSQRSFSVVLDSHVASAHAAQELESGAAFTVTLPCAAAEPADVRRPAIPGVA